MARGQRQQTKGFFGSIFYEHLVNTIRPMGVSSKSEVCGNLCQCQANYDNKNSSKASSDNLFSPIKNKMKVLKKIKKRMGLGRFTKRNFYLIKREVMRETSPVQEVAKRPGMNGLFVIGAKKKMIMIRQLMPSHGKMQLEKFSRIGFMPSSAPNPVASLAHSVPFSVYLDGWNVPREELSSRATHLLTSRGQFRSQSRQHITTRSGN